MRVESPLIHGDEGEVEPVFALEHALLVRQLEQRRRPERRADGEQRQRRLLRFAILSVQHFDAAPNVQSLRKNGQQKKINPPKPSAGASGAEPAIDTQLICIQIWDGHVWTCPHKSGQPRGQCSALSHSSHMQILDSIRWRLFPVRQWP